METKLQIICLFLTLPAEERISLLEEMIYMAGNTSASMFQDQSKFSCFEKAEAPKDTEPEQETEVRKKDFICPNCQSATVIKWGTYREEHRYRCKECGHSFTHSSGNIEYNIKKKNEFENFGKKMFDGQYYSLSFLSKRFHICKNTALDWRHKYLSSLGAVSKKEHFFSDTEMDDIWILFNEKGRRDKEKDEVRKRGNDTSPGDNNLQVKVLFTCDRKGETNISVVRAGRLTRHDIERAVGGCFEKSARLLCDKHPSILAFAKKEHIDCENFSSKQHTKNKEVHVQTVNNLAMRFKNIINNKMKGVATKYLQNYADWFKFQERIKDLEGSVAEKTHQLTQNKLSWNYFINLERLYKHFIQKYSKMLYEHPVHRTWKSEDWTCGTVEKFAL